MKKYISLLLVLTLCFSLCSTTASANSSIVSASDSDVYVSKTLTQNTTVMDEVFGGKAQDQYDEGSSAQVNISPD